MLQDRHICFEAAGWSGAGDLAQDTLSRAHPHQPHFCDGCSPLRSHAPSQSISAEADKTALLRFFGYLEKTGRNPEGASPSIEFLIREDLGDVVQEYATWLQHTQKCMFSTVRCAPPPSRSPTHHPILTLSTPVPHLQIANYLNGLVSTTSYCYANLDPSDDLLSMDPSPLAQIVNLRGQAEKASRTQSLYTAKRVGGWCEWSDVQKARQHALKKLNEQSGKSLVDQRTALRDAAAISLLSLIPPDRVGCIRKLRLGSRPGIDPTICLSCCPSTCQPLTRQSQATPSRRRRAVAG